MTGYISPFASALRQKQVESDELQKHVDEFLARGGKIQRFAQGVKSTYYDQKGAMSNYSTKRSPK